MPACPDKAVLCNAVSGSQGFMCEIAVTRFKLQSCKLELEKVKQIVAGMPGQIKYQIDAGPLLFQLRNIDEAIRAFREGPTQIDANSHLVPLPSWFHHSDTIP